MAKVNYIKMTSKNKHMISLVIIALTLLVLIILCVTGYSFKNVRNYREEPEHFFSSIKKWINGDDDEVKPANSSMTIPQHNPDIKIPDPDPPNVSIKPENESAIIDTTNLLKKIPGSNPLDKSNVPMNKPNIHLDKPINNLETKESALPTMDKLNLQFFDSTDSPDDKNYIYTGAEIGLSGANVSCGKSNKTAEKASGIAILDRDGSISDIKVLKNGKGYKLPPTVKISGGGGSGCKVKAVIDDDTKVVHFEILDGGHGYISTPTVIIEEPSNNKLCKLYIKKA